MKKEIEKKEEITSQEALVKPKNNRKRLLIILGLGLVALIALFGYLFFDKISSIFNKYAVIENKETEEELVSDENAATKLKMYKLQNDDSNIYIYEEKEFAAMLAEDEEYYSKFIEIGEYNCISSDCEAGLATNNQIVVKDFDYYLYNFESKDKRKLLLTSDSSYLESAVFDKKLYGLLFNNSDDTFTYYSLKNNTEYIFNNKYGEYGKNYVVKTNGYYSFDYTKDTFKSIPVSGDYNNIYAVYYNNVLYGYSLAERNTSEEGGNVYSFYSLTSNKIILRNLSSFVYSNAALLDGNIIADNKLYNLSSGEELHDFNPLFQDEELKDCASVNAIGNGKYTYYLAGTDCLGSSHYFIVNQEYKNLFDKKLFLDSDLGINEAGYLIINNRQDEEKSTTFSLYDFDGQLISNSKAYKEILAIYGKYAIVVDNDNYLKVINSDGSLVVKVMKWTDEMYFHSMLSSANDSLIRLIITDNSIYYDEYDEEIETGYGYEYDYNIGTKKIEKTNIEIGGYGKPVLYLYPIKKTNVTVTFENPESLTTTYTKYKNNWQVTAYPNGDLYDKNNNYYYALYWEEIKNHDISFKEGFYVTKENAIEFLEEKLAIIGLNAKERNEFIMYWLPILEKNQKSLVYFELTEERDAYNKIIINPNPDSLLRVAIHVKKVSKKVDIKEQKLQTFKRTGFTAVEWGGVED